jgi:hypothetical protein
VPNRELVVAAPIPPERDPGGMYITRQHNTRSVRTTPYGEGRRLLIVTGESFAPGAGGVTDRYQRLAPWTSKWFGVDEVAYRWAAQDNHTTDMLRPPTRQPDHRPALPWPTYTTRGACTRSARPARS